MKFIASFILLLLSTSLLIGQHIWQDVALNVTPPEGETITHYHTTSLDIASLKKQLKAAPMEFSSAAKRKAISLALPMPDGVLRDFAVVESPVMEAGISARFPAIKSYVGKGADGSQARISVSPAGLSISIQTLGGMVRIKPTTENAATYMSYYMKDVEHHAAAQPFQCGYKPDETAHGLENMSTLEFPETNEKSGVGVLPLRTYRLALSSTSAYSSRNGNTVASVLARLNQAVNLLNTVLEAEVAIRLILIDRTDELIFTSTNSEPYVNVREGGQMLGMQQNIFNNILPSDLYDIGHIFTATCDDTGGIAYRASVCSDNKAAGVTCNYNTFDYNVVSIMAHEIGHQFNGTHTMNNCTEDSQIDISNGYEVGSGSTIMSYAGVCDPANNIQGRSDAYYHVASLEEIIQFSRSGNGSTCATQVPTGNNEPSVSLPYENGFYIPVGTPFRLTANGADLDGDQITYCWEQYNTGPPSPVGSPLLNAAAFRSYPPTNSPTRTFPRKPILLNGNREDTEVLATFERDYTFRCTVRDNNPASGATVWEEMNFHSAGNAGPFVVTYPTQAGDALQAGQQVEVTWDVANTTNGKVNCQRVDISLSVDGGNSFSTLLLENVKNDGAEIVTIPDVVTTRGRIEVAAADNVFFNVSRQNFPIEVATEASFALRPMPFYQQVCLPSMASVEIQAEQIAGFEGEIMLTLENLPAGVTGTFEPTSIQAGQSAMLTLDMNTTSFDGLTQIQVVGTSADGTVSLSQAVEFNIVSNDFSEFTLSTPSNGTRGIVGNTTFEWLDAVNALTYDFELSSSPAFGADDIIASATGLRTNSFMPEEIFLNESSLFYWRVRPNNECGTGAFSVPNVFQTVNVQCVPFAQTESVAISGTGTPTVQSKITIDASGSITDLNVPLVVGSYQPVRTTEVSLISPAGTQAILFFNVCGGTSDFNLGFDDEAPDAISCPPTSGIVHQPIQPLSVFDGEDIKGDWILQFRITQSGFGSGGAIDSWELESCANIEANAPFLVTNETFPVPPSTRSQIWLETLEADDEDNATDEIIYELLSTPQHGTLYLRDAALSMGSTFTQQDIDGYRLSYEHNGDAATADDFNFLIRDTDGGWFGPAQFNIEISEDATVGTNDPTLARQVRIYPNPANTQVHIAFSETVQQEVAVRVLNLNGQQVHSTKTKTGNVLQLNTSNFADGIYFIQVSTDGAFYTERIVIQK